MMRGGQQRVTQDAVSIGLGLVALLALVWIWRRSRWMAGETDRLLDELARERKAQQELWTKSAALDRALRESEREVRNLRRFTPAHMASTATREEKRGQN